MAKMFGSNNMAFPEIGLGLTRVFCSPHKLANVAQGSQVTNRKLTLKFCKRQQQQRTKL